MELTRETFNLIYDAMSEYNDYYADFHIMSIRVGKKRFISVEVLLRYGTVRLSFDSNFNLIRKVDV